MRSDTRRRAAVLRGALEAAVTGDPIGVDQLYTAEVEGRWPGSGVRSRAALAEELRRRRGAFSDIDLSLEVVGVLDDTVVGEWRLAANHSGPLELGEGRRLDPTGRRIDLRGVMVAEFEGDRIRRFRQYWDEVALFQELGLLSRDHPLPFRSPAKRDAGRRLAQQARVLLLAEGFDNERIDELAAAFVVDHSDESVDDFVAWAIGEGVLG